MDFLSEINVNTKEIALKEDIDKLDNSKLNTTDAAASANKINTDAGSVTQPVYFKDGVPVETTYTLAKSVPSDAVFTDTKYTHPSYTAKSSGLYKVTVDSTGHVSSATAVTKSDITALGIPASDTNTHYTSKNVVNSSNTSTSNTETALTNGNVYLISVENGAVTSAHKISGSGATTVTTDTSGNIVINSTDTKYTHPTTSGNKHIPSGGSSGQILRWSADGTAVWGADNNTTYTTFVKSGSGAKAGLVPAPSTTAGTTKYLREDGTWTVPPNTTYSAATTSANGLMTSAMVTKLNGITDSADSVSFSRNLTSGTKVGTITINGTGTDLYAPTNTDTHYTTGLKVGASSTATANAAATNGNVYLNALDNTTVRDSHKITGSGATTVTSDANGVITISSTNTTYTSLKNPYALTIKGNGTTLTNGTYDGSAAKTVNITPSSIGAAASSHSHSYLPLSGGTLTGDVALPIAPSSVDASLPVAGSTMNISDLTSLKKYKTYLGTYVNSSTWYNIISIRHRNGSGDGVNYGMYIKSALTAAGNLSWGKQYGSSSWQDERTIVDSVNYTSYTVTKTGSGASGSWGISVTGSSASCTGNAATATKWATARNINGLSVDGTANRVNYGTCSTAAATAAKVVACTGFALVTGAEITVKFTVTNTAASPTLNVNSTGAKAIYYRGSAISAGYLAANRTYTFRYNGTQYDLVGDINTDTNTDTKNTTGATNTSSKIYLIGATSQSANPVTHSHDTVFVDSGGVLNSSSGIKLNSNGMYLDSWANFICGSSLYSGCSWHMDNSDGTAALKLYPHEEQKTLEINNRTKFSYGARVYSGTLSSGSATVTITNLWNYTLLIAVAYNYGYLNSSSTPSTHHDSYTSFTIPIPVQYINGGNSYIARLPIDEHVYSVGVGSQIEISKSSTANSLLIKKKDSTTVKLGTWSIYAVI